MTKKELLQIALEARKNAYAPYSHFCVGAALLSKSGIVYTGCNVENAAYTPSNCAERTAIFKAVSEGERDFLSIAIVGGPEGNLPTSFCAPCGVCRQVMNEFVDSDKFTIILGKGKCLDDDEMKEYTLRELFPESFGPGDLGD